MDWQTWSPFQSEDVRQVVAHLSPEEKETLLQRSRNYGRWVALTFAMPIALAVVLRDTVVIVIAAILVSMHLACIPLWLKSTRRLLCNTKWAREQGLDSAQLKLFGFRRRKRMTT
jgi:hypothetical protein